MGTNRQRRELTTEPDLSAALEELKRWHDPAFRDWLVDALTDLAGLADAKDPDPSFQHIIDPPSRREH